MEERAKFLEALHDEKYRLAQEREEILKSVQSQLDKIGAREILVETLLSEYETDEKPAWLPQGFPLAYSKSSKREHQVFVALINIGGNGLKEVVSPELMRMDPEEFNTQEKADTVARISLSALKRDGHIKGRQIDGNKVEYYIEGFTKKEA